MQILLELEKARNAFITELDSSIVDESYAADSDCVVMESCIDRKSTEEICQKFVDRINNFVANEEFFIRADELKIPSCHVDYYSTNVVFFAPPVSQTEVPILSVQNKNEPAPRLNR